MNRMLTFAKYLLVIVIFYFVTDYISFYLINTTYEDIDLVSEMHEPKVQISEAKATTINGYIKGSIENNTNETINGKYLKINLLADNDVNLGEKFVEIKELEKNSVQEFEMDFNLQNVDKYKLSITNSIEGATEEALISDQHFGFFTATTILILLYIL